MPAFDLGLRRDGGITHVLDKGLGARAWEDLLESAGDYIDIVKFGWGTGYLTQNIEEKIEVYREAGIATCFGGTLLELALLQGRFDDYRRLLRRLKMTHVELSTGIIELTLEERQRYIRSLAQDFVVFSEVGSKDAQHIIPPYRWVEQVEADLAAGSWRVICEARESGTVGIYHSNGEVKAGLIEEIVARVEVSRLLFEAPQKAQQTWLVQKFGSNVNLGNIPSSDVIALETVRVGLRADTMSTLFDVAGWNGRHTEPTPTPHTGAGARRSG